MVPQTKNSIRQADEEFLAQAEQPYQYFEE